MLDEQEGGGKNGCLWVLGSGGCRGEGQRFNKICKMVQMEIFMHTVKLCLGLPWRIISSQRILDNPIMVLSHWLNGWSNGSGACESRVCSFSFLPDQMLQGK